jgi:hypothetical protein
MRIWCRYTDSHPRSLFTLVAFAPIFRPSHPRGYFARSFVSLPIRSAGTLARIFGLPAVGRFLGSGGRHLCCRCRRGRCRGWRRCRRLCGFGSAFSNICFFSDLGCFVCGLVSSPFLFTGLYRFLLRERRSRRKCKARNNNGRAHNKCRSFDHVSAPVCPSRIDLCFFPHTGGTLQRFTESHIDSS